MTETEMSHKEVVDQTSRRKMLLVAAKHAHTAVDFVELVGVLGLERELEELLQDREDLRTAVTNARQASVFADILTIHIEED